VPSIGLLGGVEGEKQFVRGEKVAVVAPRRESVPNRREQPLELVEACVQLDPSGLFCAE
jgi:hypothetical protein